MQPVKFLKFYSRHHINQIIALIIFQDYQFKHFFLFFLVHFLYFVKQHVYIILLFVCFHSKRFRIQFQGLYFDYPTQLILFQEQKYY